MLKQAALWGLLATAAAAQTFTATGSLAQARALAASAVLSDGSVLVAGGMSAGAALRSAEIYDPATGKFHSTGALLRPRSGAQAALLANGKVWVVGGETSVGAGASSELYDPASGVFAAGPSLPHPLESIVLVAVPGGSILVFGQATDCSAPNCPSPVYKFDPASGQLASDGQLQVTRNDFTATLLPTGKVLIVSGWAGNSMATSPTDSYELFDPDTGASVLGNAPLEAFFAAAALLSNGQALICGGGNHDTGFSRQCFLYDPAANSFSETGSMATGRNRFFLTVLNDGRVLVMGGANNQAPDAEMYDPALGTFSSAGNFLTPRVAFSAALLNHGQVLVAGGDAVPPSGGAPSTALGSAELFSAASPVPGFSLAVQPAQAIVASGTTASFTVSAAGANGFNSSINLSCSNQGSATCSFNPGAITAGETSTLTLGNLNVAQAGVVSFQIMGTSGTTLAASVPAQADLEPPVPVIAPAALSFGDENVGGKSAAQTITLVNSGESPLQISGISASGDFIQTNNCPASLVNVGNPTCTITVLFAPTASGDRTGSLSIADNAPFSPQSLALSGIGVAADPAAVASLNPTSLIFGSEAVGATSPALAVTLSNSGTANLVIADIAASGDFAQTNNCGGTLPANKNCTVSVTFTPTASGARTGQLTFADSASGSPQVIPLSGTGAGATGPTPSISLLPANGGSATTAINPGQTASFPLSLSGVAGFVGTVSLACSGAPAGAACTTNPSTVAVGSAIIPVAVTVTTTAAAAAPLSLPRSPSGWWLLLLAALLAWIGFAKPRFYPARRCAVILLFTAGLALAACGGNSSPAPALHPVSPTPAGTYTLTVTAISSGAPAGQTQVTLVVN